MKKNLLILLPIALLIFSGCKKDVGYLTNGAAGTGDTYFPVTKSTTWTYADGPTTSANLQTTVMTGGTAVFNNKTYYTAADASGATPGVNGYIYSSNHVYSERAVVTSNGTTATEDITFLNEATPVGSAVTLKISDDGLVNSVPSREILTTMESGISKTVLGQPFSNVIHTKAEIQFDYGLGNGFETFFTYDFYLAKNIGLIETDGTLSFFGLSLTTNSYLKSYTIK